MTRTTIDDPDSILTSKPGGEFAETLLFARTAPLPSPVEVAIIQYADSLEQLLGSAPAQDNPYTQGFVAGLRAAAKVAANTSGI